MNREYNCKVSSQNSKGLLKKIAKYDRGLLFLPHPIYSYSQRFCNHYMQIRVDFVRSEAFWVDLPCFSGDVQFLSHLANM